MASLLAPGRLCISFVFSVACSATSPSKLGFTEVRLGTRQAIPGPDKAFRGLIKQGNHNQEPEKGFGFLILSICPFKMLFRNGSGFLCSYNQTPKP